MTRFRMAAVDDEASHDAVRAVVHGRGAGGPLPGRRQARRGRSGARRIRITVTWRGDAHPVPKRKGGRHDSELHRGWRGGAGRGHG